MPTTSAPFAARRADVSDNANADASAALPLDVHRAGMFEAANPMLPGASQRDPPRVADWVPQLPAGREVIG